MLWMSFWRGRVAEKVTDMQGKEVGDAGLDIRNLNYI